jgi:hypothetical protein
MRQGEFPLRSYSIIIHGGSILEVKSIEDAPLKITHKFQATDRILTKMISSFPRTPRSFLREINLPHNLVVSDLAICSMSLYLCTIQLHGSTAAHDEDSRSKMLSAASDIVAVAQGLHKIPEIYWPMGITVGVIYFKFSTVSLTWRFGCRWAGEMLAKFSTGKSYG